MSRRKHRSYSRSLKRDNQLKAIARAQMDDLVDEYENGPDDYDLSIDEEYEHVMEITAEPEPEELEEPKKPQPIYVLDTNIILSCVDVIYDPDEDDWHEPLNFSPEINHAHLVIPMKVFDELDHLKGKKINARIAFDRLQKFFPNSGRKLREIMNLEKPIPTGWDDQVISLLPLHRSFTKKLPWLPNGGDNDGWIAVTALAATMIAEGKPVDGTAKIDFLDRSNRNSRVALLTNDKSLRSKADNYAVRTLSYTFKERPPFTGFRDLIVPAEMFEQFYYEQSITADEFEYFMPNQLPLVANEYVLMTPENDVYPRGYFVDNDPSKNLARFSKENGRLYPVRFVKREGKEPPNPGIATYYDAMNDTERIHIVTVSGEAGTGKTYNAICHGIMMAEKGFYRKIIILTTMSAKNPMGALPGGEDAKLEPMVGFVKDAIEAYLLETPEFKRKREELKKHGLSSSYRERHPDARRDGRDNTRRNNRRRHDDYDDNVDYCDQDYMRADDFEEPHNRKKDKTFYTGQKGKAKDSDESEEKLSFDELLAKQCNYIYRRYFKCVPYEYARGRSFQDAFVIIDEAQRAKIDDIETSVTRPAKNSFLVVCGDVTQIHDKTPEKMLKNGFVYTRLCCYDDPGAAHIHLTKNMRDYISKVFTSNRDRVRRILGMS